MSQRPTTGELHAFVDNCLSRREREDFETRLREDAELRRRVDLLRAQNEAIRLAFGASAASRDALSFGRPANSDAPAQAPVLPGVRRGARWEAYEAARAAANPETAPARSRWAFLVLGLYRAALFAACVGLWLVVWPGGALPDPRAALIEAGAAAYRAFAAGAPNSLDVATADPVELLSDLGLQYRRFDLAARLAAGRLKLLGAKSAPGIAGGAAMAILDDDRGQRIGLLIEPLDAPPAPLPLRGQHSGLAVAAVTSQGFGLAAIGPNRAAVDALTAPEAFYAVP